MSAITRRTQRDREDFAVDLFLQAHSGEHGEPWRPRSDPPDFLVDIEGERIGIELTETVEPNRREREELAFKIIGAARARYEQAGLPPVYVWILYEDTPIPKDGSIPERISHLVESLGPERLSADEERFATPEQLATFDLSFIASVRVIRAPHGKANTWGKTDAGTVRALTREDVERILTRKEKAVGKFLQDPGCRPWLVIYTFDDRVSGSADLTPEAATARYGSRFEKVFVLDAPRKALIELDLAPPAASRVSRLHPSSAPWRGLGRRGRLLAVGLLGLAVVALMRYVRWYGRRSARVPRLRKP
jgi:hypothetical protein